MSYPYRSAAFTSLILMGSALMASNALAQQERPCETCEASDPANRSAKAIGMPMQMPRGPAGPERPDCCPPVIANKAYLGTSFAFHQLPGENSNQHYGLSYTPNAAFNAQMTLWAPYAASALAVPGWTPQAVVMAAEMRTDAPSTIAVNYSTHPAWNNWPPTIADFAAGTTVRAPVYISAWWTNSTTWHDNNEFHDQASGWTAPPNFHMVPDGRRYMMAFSFYMFEWSHDRWRLRPIDCQTPMLSWRFNGMNLRAAGGAKPMLQPIMAVGRLKAPELQPGKDLIEQAQRMRK